MLARLSDRGTRVFWLGVGTASFGLILFDWYRIGQRGDSNSELVCSLFLVTLVSLIMAFTRPAVRTNVLVCALSMVGAALVYQFVFSPPAIQSLGEFESEKYWVSHNVLGYAGVPGAKVRAAKIRGSQTLYDVTYHLDEYGRRVIPLERSEEGSHPFLLFFGGSITFGEGVEQNETWAYHVANSFEEYVPVNYAFHGWGPIQMLDTLFLRDLSAEVAQRNGVALYLWHDSHLGRVTGTVDVKFSWGKGFSRYTNDDDQLKRVGKMLEARTFPEYLYFHTAKALGLLRYFKHSRATDQDIELLGAVFEGAKKKLDQEFEDCRFVILIPSDSLFAERLIPHFEEVGIEYVKLSFAKTEDLLLPYDRHPTPEAHRLLAEDVVPKLRPLLEESP